MKIHRYLALLFIIIITLLFIPICQTSAQVYYFNHYQVEDGVSNNAILCSVQDKDGFMWFGTRDGLNRFDGYNFRHFYADMETRGGLGSNFIHSITVSRDNQLWIGTDQGVYILDPRTEQFTDLPDVRSREIVKIEEDSFGNIWFIANNELFCYEVTTKTLVQKTYRKQYVVSSFTFDNNQEVWIGAEKKLISLNTQYTYTLPLISTTTTEIKELFVDKKNNIWMGTSKEGLFKYDSEKHTIKHLIRSPFPFSPLYIRDIAQFNDTSLWIGSEAGLIIYNTLTDQYHILRHEKDNPWSLTDNAIYTVRRDHQGGMWVGTYFGGIQYYHPQHTYFEKIFPRSTSNSIQGHAIREIIEDRYQNIWIGTEDHGLTMWNQHDNSFLTLGQDANLAHSNIHGLAIAGDSLLVGTFHQGMDVVNVRTKKVIRHFDNKNTQGRLGDNFVFSIYRTRAGRILVATSRGAYEFFPGEDRFQTLRHLERHIWYTSIYEDKQGCLWFTTWRDGLIKLSPATGEVVRYKHEEEDSQSLNSNRANKVFQDSEGNIWIATESGMAVWQEKTNNFHRITKHDGLPSNLILGFEEDAHKNLWISTSRGLVKMNIHTRKIDLFDTELGLLGLQFNYNSVFKDSRGFLYFGSSKGLVRFDPERMTEHFNTDLRAPVFITGIQTHQRELTIGGHNGNLSQSVIYTNQITLNHDESTISIDFAALNFVSAKSTSYRYRLVGLDTSWTFLRTNGKANFTKIPPGKYRFEVMATDANGTPISEQKQLHITIKPPFWASTPAFIVYAILTFLFLYYALSIYDQRIKEKNRRRLEVIKNHKEQELYKAKMDFFMRITHDIKTPLTLIKAPLEKILLGADATKTEKWLHSIQQNTEKLLTLTDNLLDFRKIESSEFSLQLQTQKISDLIHITLQEFAPLLESKKLSLDVDMDEELEAYIDVETIYKILSNLLSNAIKYAEHKVLIGLHKNSARDTFIIQVKNDGVLLTEEEVQQIFKPFQRASSHYRIKGSGLGLALAYSFAEIHRGSLHYDKNKENLNVFVLEIPLNIENNS
ncbi:hypothetical protein FAZ15_10535 [Sphingobacterium olei]|uniref:histidine kinase n=1 Tax=Sphingobacterium olei TaxID=2571155 RepID=A0A4U0PCQ7_9SPHI|nr:sensor histidine kinase [Sphingobacterium olei]TJZ60434.1 hypothetical protein FAZ15_10535 [Sphingobacterium olei]